MDPQEKVPLAAIQVRSVLKLPAYGETESDDTLQRFRPLIAGKRRRDVMPGGRESTDLCSPV